MSEHASDVGDKEQGHLCASSAVSSKRYDKEKDVQKVEEQEMMKSEGYAKLARTPCDTAREAMAEIVDEKELEGGGLPAAEVGASGGVLFPSKQLNKLNIDELVELLLFTSVEDICVFSRLVSKNMTSAFAASDELWTCLVPLLEERNVFLPASVFFNLPKNESNNDLATRTTKQWFSSSAEICRERIAAKFLHHQQQQQARQIPSSPTSADAASASPSEPEAKSLAWVLKFNEKHGMTAESGIETLTRKCTTTFASSGTLVEHLSFADFNAWANTFMCQKCSSKPGSAAYQCACCGDLLCTSCSVANECSSGDFHPFSIYAALRAFKYQKQELISDYVASKFRAKTRCPFALCNTCHTQHSATAPHRPTRDQVFKMKEPALLSSICTNPSCNLQNTCCPVHVDGCISVCSYCGLSRCALLSCSSDILACTNCNGLRSPIVCVSCMSIGTLVSPFCRSCWKDDLLICKECCTQDHPH